MSESACIGRRLSHARGVQCITRLLVITVVLTLGACRSIPPPKQSLAARQVRVLEDLGFKKLDDGWLLKLPDKVAFAFDKADLAPEMIRRVDDSAAQLLAVEIRRLRIEGHSDNIGTREFNLTLSQQRADAVAHEFVAQGYADDAVQRVGFGPDHPAASNDTREGRAENRRVEIIVPVSSLAVGP